MATTWSEFESEVKGRMTHPGPPCQVGELLKALPDEAEIIVRRALDSRELSSPALHKALVKRVGQDAPSFWSIGNHRRRNCQCKS